jgi:hypothetical protein
MAGLEYEQESGVTCFEKPSVPVRVQESSTFVVVTDSELVFPGARSEGVAERVVETGPAQEPPVTVTVTGTAFAVPPAPVQERP